MQQGQAFPQGQAPMLQGQGGFPSGAMHAPMSGQGPVSNASFSQITVPPSSGNGPTSNGLPQAQAPRAQGQAQAEAPRKSKSGIVLFLLFLLVLLACMGAWLKLKHKASPAKHGAREVPSLVVRV
jgi:hypothetical protein